MKAKIVDQKMQDEMVGVLTAISIVSRRLASRLMELDEHEKTTSSPRSRVKV